MPVYCYSRDGHVIDKFFAAGEAPQTVEENGLEYSRDYQAEHTITKPAATWPRWSEAAGVAPEQAAEATAEMTRQGVPTEYCPETGRCKFESAAHQRKALPKMGLRDRSAWN